MIPLNCRYIFTSNGLKNHRLTERVHRYATLSNHTINRYFLMPVFSYEQLINFGLLTLENYFFNIKELVKSNGRYTSRLKNLLGEALIERLDTRPKDFLLKI